MNLADQKAWEAELAHTYGPDDDQFTTHFRDILNVAEDIRQQAIDAGYSEFQARRYAEQVVQEYFDGIARYMRRGDAGTAHGATGALGS